jgi:hypothetical protein
MLAALGIATRAIAVRIDPSERPPGAVAPMPDQRLDEQPGDRRRDPQDRQLVELGTERLEDPAGAAVLQSPDDLHSEQAAAHVPDLPDRQPRPPRRRRW